MKRKLRIVVVSACPFPFPRGTPVRALRLTEALARLGHDMHVATYHLGEGPVDPSVRVHRLRAPRGIAPLQPGPTPGKLFVLDPLLLGTLHRTLTRYGPFDVIHAHHYEGLLIALATRRLRRRAIPLVYDAHTLLGSELPSYPVPAPRAFRRTIGRVFDRWLPGRADHIVAVSDSILERLVASGAAPPGRVTVIANGIEPEAFAASPRRRAPTADGGTVVYAGNLAPYHRVDLLLEAFAHVVARRPRASLRLLTDSPSASVAQHAARLGLASRVEVRSVPFSALPYELAAADVAVNPRPVCDGIPQKNLNYMAAGLPLVAFEGSLHPCRDGETGTAVRTVGATDLGEAILEMLSMPDRAARIGESAQDLARRAFSWDERAERVERIYRALMPDRSGARAITPISDDEDPAAVAGGGFGRTGARGPFSAADPGRESEPP